MAQVLAIGRDRTRANAVKCIPLIAEIPKCDVEVMSSFSSSRTELSEPTLSGLSNVSSQVVKLRPNQAEMP